MVDSQEPFRGLETTYDDMHTPCNPHPDAPHGFNRNASHDAGRYICDCESWEPVERDPVTIEDFKLLTEFIRMETK